MQEKRKRDADGTFCGASAYEIFMQKLCGADQICHNKDIKNLTTAIAEGLPFLDYEDECVFLCRNLHGTQNSVIITI